MTTEAPTNDDVHQPRTSRSWARRTETIAAFVLAILFLAWVGSIFVRQRMAGAGVEVVHDSAAAGQYRVNLNEADKGELMLLPGIGDVRSDRILAWRSEHGRFKTLDEVKSASGLSAKGMEAIRELVTVGDTEGE